MAEDTGSGVWLMKSLGRCKICQKSGTMPDLEAHTKTHTSKGDKDTHYIIRIDDGQMFWMYIQVYGNSLLRTLDKFLRQEWLECCGHYSTFTVNDVTYNSSASLGKGMNVKLRNILEEGTVFVHEYDFGSPTVLRLTVVYAKVPPAVVGKRGIHVLVVHDPVKFECAACGADARKVCSDCGQTLCMSCAPKHGCGEDLLLDAVQSPRMGVCAYNSHPATLHRDGTSTHYVETGGWVYVGP